MDTRRIDQQENEEGGGKHANDTRYCVYAIPRQNDNESQRGMRDNERAGFPAALDRTPYIEIKCRDVFTSD